MALASRSARRGQQQSLRRMRQVSKLGVGAFAEAAQPGMGSVGVFLRGGLVSSPVRDADVITSAVAALVRQRDEMQSARARRMP